MSDARRGELHRGAVAALQARPGGDPARIAHHAEAAGDGATLAWAARDACLLAAARTAHREAILHGDRVLGVQRTAKTVSVHVSNILSKLAAGGRTQAVAVARRRGLLTD